MDELQFGDRVVVVTGAGRGIGRAHALLLASRGARIVVGDLGADIDGTGASTGPADEVVAEIQAAGGTAVACYDSVAHEAGAAAIIDCAVTNFGRIDALVNNAGVNEAAPFEQLTIDAFRRMLNVHFFGTLFTSRAAWPHFVEAGYGRIVNTVSEAVLGGNSLTAYAAAKGAVFALTRCLATEGEPHGINVNAIAPRAFTRMSATNTYASAPASVIEKAKAVAPPEMNSPTVAFLAHPSCSFSGEVLRTGTSTVARLAVVEARGMQHESFTPEEVVANLDRVLDVEAGTVKDYHLLSRPEPSREHDNARARDTTSA